MNLSKVVLPLLGVAVAALSAPFRATGAEPASPAFLPDSAVLIRVADRVVTAEDFRNSYYRSWAEYRPASDSLGRIAFLDQLVNKEVLAYVALHSNYSFGFEERMVLRQATRVSLSNVLYQRMVSDSADATDQDVERLKQEYACEKNLQHIVFGDRATAERVRQDLIAKRITWQDAHRRYSTIKNEPPLGDIGWARRAAYTPEVASVIFDLEVGQVSELYKDEKGYHLVRVVGRRPAELPPLAQYAHILRREVRQTRRAQRMDEINARLRGQAGLVLVDSNLAWASGYFETPPPIMDSLGVLRPRRLTKLPIFAPADTGRILARWRDGQMSLGRFMSLYGGVSPYMRTPVNTPSLLGARVESFALEGDRAQLAIELGLERDPLTIAMIGRKREEILVEHLYQDSIANRVRSEPAERRKYYKEHPMQFYTQPAVTFAGLGATTRAGADSIAARLRAGEPVGEILRQDSLRYGRATGRVDQLGADDQGHTFYKLLMEDLRQGEVAVEPGERGGYWVVKSLAFDPGRQLPYEEAERYVIESLENIQAEKLLKDFIARHKRGLRIEIHPELLARVDLSDPLGED